MEAFVTTFCHFRVLQFLTHARCIALPGDNQDMDHPSSLAVRQHDETCVKMVEAQLRRVILVHQKYCFERQPIFLVAFRSTASETISMMHTRIVFGRELHLPCDLLFGVPPSKEHAVCDQLLGGLHESAA
jgi:hypothetical protein